MTEPMQFAVKRALEPVEVTVVELPSHSRLPRLDLGVDWGSPWQEFRSSWNAYFNGERAPSDAEMPADSDLRVEWIEGKLPGRAFAASTFWHVVAIAIILLPIWHFLASNPPNLAPVRIELTWTNPSQDLPPISLPGHELKPSPKGDPARRLPRKGADAFHPRQTILSEPAQLTHPRQTLIQPDAPATPPKIETPMPNIAEWAMASPAPPKPRLHLGSAAAAPEMRHRAAADLTAPEVNQEKNAGPLDIAASPAVNAQPRMPVEPMSRAVAERHTTQSDNPAAPEVAAVSAGDANLHRLIAISAAPAPPSPEISVPRGNLAARVAISPDGKQPGVPGGAENGSAGNGGAAGEVSSRGGRGASGAASARASSSPAAISISGGNGRSGSGGLAPGGRSPARLNLKPPSLADGMPAPRNGPTVIGAIDPNLPPEKILSGKEVYTLHINMPNLTSVSGTNWIMNFAQLEEGNPPYAKPKGTLSGLELIRKVDPKYPPTLIKENVDGEVVLYAIIRKNGTVDSIQVVRSVDPQLDRNAVEALSRWEFHPAQRNGEPVDLEAVVRIPFHFRKTD